MVDSISIWTFQCIFFDHLIYKSKNFVCFFHIWGFPDRGAAHQLPEICIRAEILLELFKPMQSDTECTHDNVWYFDPSASIDLNLLLELLAITVSCAEYFWS